MKVMPFELDEFLASLKGLTKSRMLETITFKQYELMAEASQLQAIRNKMRAYRSYRYEITFLHNLGNEINYGLVVASSGIDRLRISNVLRYLDNSR